MSSLHAWYDPESTGEGVMSGGGVGMSGGGGVPEVVPEVGLDVQLPTFAQPGYKYSVFSPYAQIW